MEGSLPGFFNCMASDEARVNVLSQADVEDIYECVYTPGESYVIKMGEDELVFERRDKLYIADMSDWIKDSYKENDNSLSFLTVAEKEYMYIRKERRKALQAGEFVKNAGFPSKIEAIKMKRWEHSEYTTLCTRY